MGSPRSVDRRVKRTRRALHEALVALILERGWDETSVERVCERADVGRSTFYTHFADKEDLLLAGFDELKKALRAGRASAEHAGKGTHAGGGTGAHGPYAHGAGGRGEDRPLGFALDLIEHARDHLRLFRAVVGKRSGQVVQKRFQQLVLDLVHEDLAALAPKGPRLDATAHYLAGAFFQLLTWWLDARTPLAAADLAAHFQRLSAPALRGVRD